MSDQFAIWLLSMLMVSSGFFLSGYLIGHRRGVRLVLEFGEAAEDNRILDAKEID